MKVGIHHKSLDTSIVILPSWKEGSFPDTIQDVFPYCIDIISTIPADFHRN